MLNISTPDTADIIAWALVDSLWQATLIAATLGAAHMALALPDVAG